MDCTAENTREVCKQLGVRSYPTLTVFSGDTMYTYKGSRGLSALVEFTKSYQKTAKKEHTSLITPSSGPRQYKEEVKPAKESI